MVRHFWASRKESTWDFHRERPWCRMEDAPADIRGVLVPDVLGLVFGFLDLRTRAGVLPLVCKARWWQAALHSPSAWRHIELTNFRGVHGAATQALQKLAPPHALLSISAQVLVKLQWSTLCNLTSLEFATDKEHRECFSVSVSCCLFTS